MSEKLMEEWLIRYLVVLVVGTTALLTVIYGYALAESLLIAAVAFVVLALTTGVVLRDLNRWRAI